ncbi:Glycoprotein-N-acetylgalactosamine 3-beta-galactosyltransferase 1 [Portunus trituberculatus]|uniref:N-acetylgalactosaminide beta-1,3-galactosyltransferase n=1 Tax=Portunus trituberculatus TaxID=210409 RepID=A0A5B7DL09_PORTR|nr:Glycoprotein-N-acetylgalactosamine 3-beta-galactosyltransferase 1 [Portunus trituberculatus]
MVVTTPQHHRGRSRHLKATWGHWGNGAYPKTVFLSSIPDDVLQNVIFSHFSSYEDLWGKVVDGFLQLNASAADWFLKADDDTFLIYPNLLNLLEHLDPSEALYLGLPLIYRPEEGEEITYMSGGAGYVLSRAALTRLQAARDLAYCRYPGHTRYEDVNMGYCMASLGVRAADTRDGLGRPRFLPYPPWRLLQPEPHPDFAWLVNFSKYKFRFVSMDMTLICEALKERESLDEQYKGGRMVRSGRGLLGGRGSASMKEIRSFAVSPTEEERWRAELWVDSGTIAVGKETVLPENIGDVEDTVIGVAGTTIVGRETELSVGTVDEEDIVGMTGTIVGWEAELSVEIVGVEEEVAGINVGGDTCLGKEGTGGMTYDQVEETSEEVAVGKLEDLDGVSGRVIDGPIRDVPPEISEACEEEACVRLREGDVTSEGIS